MLTLAPDFVVTVELLPDDRLLCDVALTEGSIETDTAFAREYFDQIIRFMPDLWSALASKIPENQWVMRMMADKQLFHMSVLLTTDAEIHALNREYRHKDTATDVLSIPMLEDLPEMADIASFPVLELGEIYVSLEWARNHVHEADEHTGEISPTIGHYLLERVAHGSLHLLGVHHDTISAYNKVKDIQRYVLESLFATSHETEHTE